MIWRTIQCFMSPWFQWWFMFPWRVKTKGKEVDHILVSSQKQPFIDQVKSSGTVRIVAETLAAQTLSKWSRQSMDYLVTVLLFVFTPVISSQRTSGRLKGGSSTGQFMKMAHVSSWQYDKLFNFPTNVVHHIHA